jgi:hypothetical protein
MHAPAAMTETFPLSKKHDRESFLRCFDSLFGAKDLQ